MFIKPGTPITRHDAQNTEHQVKVMAFNDPSYADFA
jgi:hypothetical protein